MSGSERRKARDVEAAEPAARETGLWRITRKGGGVLIEEVSATDVQLVHQHARDIYDIAMSRFTSEIHRRISR